MLHQSFLGKWKLLSSSSSAAKLNLCGKRRRWCLFYFSRNKEGTFYSRNFFSTWLSSAVKLSVEADQFSLIGFELRHRRGNKVYKSTIRINIIDPNTKTSSSVCSALWESNPGHPLDRRIYWPLIYQALISAYMCFASHSHRWRG